MMNKTEFGMVIAIWGQAWVRNADGGFRPLQLGDAIHKGSMVLTAQNSIVQIAQTEPAPDANEEKVAAAADTSDAERVIAELNKADPGREAPAAGLAGGEGGNLQPGLRVERIVEVVTPGGQLRSSGLDALPFEPEFPTETAPELSAASLALPSMIIDAVEQGPNVGFALTPPSGVAQVRIDAVPTVGQLTLADGTLVVPGTMLTAQQLGGLVYMPPADYLPGTPVGPMRYTATLGASNGSGIVAFNVAPINDAPAALGGAATAAEDTLVPVSLTGSDVDGTVTSVVIDRLPSIGTLLLADGVTPVLLGQTLTAAQASALVLRPAANQSGTDSIGFTVIDNAGAASTPGDWTVRITPVDDLPQADPDTFTVAEDGAVTINVRFNDGDVETPVLTITRVNGNPVTDGGPAVVVPNGTVQLLGGQLVFTPAPNYSGPANFNYTITDGTNTADAAVSGTVTSIDDLPIANPDAFVVAEDGSVTINVVGNDIDIDGDTLTITQVNGTPIADGGPAVAVPDGNVRLVGGQLVFTPAPDYNGPASFDYTMSDGTTSVPATVSGTVTPVVDVPQLQLPGAQSTGEDSALVFSNANGNTLSVADADGGTLTVTVGVTQGTFTLGATAGLLTLSGNGSGTVTLSGSAAAINAALVGSTYTPNADFHGSSSLTLSVNDGTTASASSVAIGVLPVADITADAVVTAEDTAIAINVLANDTFEGAGPQIVAVNGQAITAGGPAIAVANGGVALNTLGQLVFTPAPNYNGPTGFSYTANSGGVSETASVAVNVTPVADVATVSLNASASVAEGGAIVYTATLSTPALAPVTVQLSNGATINIAAGATIGTVAVAAPADDVVVDAGNISASISTASGGGFDVLSVDATPANTAITDTVDATTLSLTASPSVAEGGLITYTASLTAPAQSAVTVNLSNGASITIAAGASSGSVNVAAPGDDAYVDAGGVSATVASASGGGFENLVVNPAAATTSVSDTLNTTTLSLSASLSVAEGGSIVYTAALTAPAQTALSVTLSNGAVITIAAGASSGSVSVAAPSDDAHIDAGTVSATISSASGGNFEQLAIDPTAATTAISDTIDTTTVSLTASPAVAEGGAITYTASLNAAAQTPVTVSLSNGATIVIVAGASTGSVSVAAPADDVYVDAGSVSATISAASGGNFEALVVNPAAATTAVSDTLQTTTVSLGATPAVAEGGSIVYTASLTSPAQTAVTVTLSNGATIVIAAGANSNSVSVPAPGDDVYADAGSVSATISTAVGGNFEVLAISPAAATTTVSDTVDTTTITLTASPSVAEGGSIVYAASLTSAAQSPVSVTLSNGAVITIAAGSNSGTVSVGAPGDDVHVDAGNVSATISSAAGGGFESLAVNPAAATTAVTDTIDTTTLSIAGAASVTEGGTATYALSLTAPAQSTVTVNLAYSGTAADGSDFSGVATVTIPAGSSSTNFDLATLDDALFEGTESFTVTVVSATGGTFENLVVSGSNSSVGTTLLDDDATPAISVSDANVIESDYAVFTVSLSGASASATTFTPSLASGSATVGTDTTSTIEYFNGSAWVAVTAAGVTIPAGSTSVQVRVATTDDAAADSGETFTLTATVTAGSTANASAFGTATITDEAVPGPEDTTNLSLSASASVAEGGSILYTATLSGPANAPLNVTLSNGAVIAVGAGATSGSIAVAAPTNDVVVDAGTVSAMIAGTSGGGFENLAVSGAPAVTMITDTLDNTTVSLSATPSAAEGGTITYTASLTSAAQSAVTVNLSNSATIVIAAGASSGSVNVPAPGDDVFVDAGGVSATIATASGGNFENLVVNGAAATTTIGDTIDATTVSLAASLGVAEGGAIVYTASLTSPAGTALTVTLSNGATITIAAGASSGSVSVAAPSDDVIVDAGSVSATIASASGGNFESLVVDGTAATTSITDTIDTTTVSLTATPVVAEGGSIIYTASLTSAAQTAVTVTLDNGAVITIAAGANSGSVSLPAPGDDVIVDAGSVQRSIASATGGSFENLAVNATPASTGITDTVDTTTVSLSASPSVAEGGSITYTASLTSAAQTAVTVTLDDGTVITIAAGASSGSVSLPAPGDDAIVDAGSVSRTIASASGGNFENLAVDPSAATTTIADTIDTTTVSLTATPSVAEGGTITYTAALTSAAQTAVTVTLDNGTTITIAAGASSGSVSLAAPADDVVVDAGTVTRTIASATGGNFENLAVNATPANTSIADTVDTTTVSLTASASVAEGGAITYTASLTSVAQSAVTVTLDDGTVITIAAGASSGSVSVSAPSDDVIVDAGSVARNIASASGGNFENLAVNATPATTSITDTIDTTTVSLSATPGVAEGGSIVYTASLTSAAASPVTVTLDDGTVISIAAGASSGSVSVAAPSDDVHVDAGPVSRTIASATGGNFENLQISAAPAGTSISDTIDTTTLSLTGSANVVEGASGSYAVSLTSAAQSAVTITLAYSGTAADGSDFTGVATVTIPAGSSSSNFGIATLDDALAEGIESFSVSLVSATGGNFENLTISGSANSVTTTLLDNDGTPSLTVSDSAVVEGGFAVFTVALSNASATATTFAPTLTSGSATVGVDTDTALEWFDGGTWQPVTGAGVTIAAGGLSVQVRVATTDDALADSGETFTLTATVTGGTTATAAASGVATLSDEATPDTVLVSLAGPASVVEGASTGNYTVTLGQSAVSTVTVNLNYAGTAANGSDYSGVVSVVIPAGATSATFDLATLDDVVADSDETIVVSLGAISGGGFEAIAAHPINNAVTTTINDEAAPDTTTVSLSASASVAEGGAIVYTATLTNPAASAVTVTLSNGATIGIAAGATSGSVSVTAPSDDVYVDAGSVSATISGASGGGFEALAVNPAAATTTITDTIDTTTVTLTATPSVAEGGAIVYTASLTSAAASPVTVTLSIGATITIAAGSSSNSVSVPAPGNDAIVDAGSVSATIATATGGSFENLGVNPAAATTAITDTIDTTTLSLTATAAVAEGGNIVYTASLTSAAATAVTVTLDNGATITIAAGASLGSVTVAAPGDDVYVDAGSVSAAISGASGGGFESLAIDNTPAATAVSDTIQTTTVSLTATPSVAEGGTITYTASLTSLAQTAVTVTLSNGATIAIAAGASTGTVNVAAPSDDAIVDAGSVSVTIDTASGGNFEALAVNPAAATTAISDTIDTTTVSLSASPSVAEGGSIIYTASLTSAAASPVTVTLSNGATITIATGASTGTVSVPAPSDDVVVDVGSVSATIASAAGGSFEDLDVDATAAATTITDTIDTTTVSLTATPSVAEGGAITYTASLTSAAQTPVSVTLSNGATITIAAGASSGTVSVPAPSDDVYVDAGSVSATISSATGGSFESLAVNGTAATTTITDTVDTTTVSLTASPSVAEGGTITYTASLTSVAQSAVTVTLSNGATITIAAGSSSGTVNVAAPADDVIVDAGSVSATISSASGGNFEALAVNPAAATTTITDTIDTTTVSLSASPSVAEGGNIVYTASLTSAAQSAVTVTLSNGATITIAAGASSGTVSVPAPGDDVVVDAGNVSATISGATGGGFENLVVNGASAVTAIADTVDTTTVSLTASPSVAEGGTITYTASLTSAAQAAVTVTLDNGATINIAAGSSSGTVNVAAPGDDVYVEAGSVSAQIASAAGGNFENLVVTATPAVTTITDTVDTTTVSLSASASVAEGGNIVYTASLGSPAASPVTVTLSNGATITILANASSGSVSVPAPSDDVVVDAGNVSATIASATGGNFESLQINPAAATTAITDTIDATTLSLTGSASVAEGASGSYTLSLTSPADTTVTVTLAYSGSAADGADFTGVATVTIPAGASSASFNIATLNDSLAEGAESFTVSMVSASGGNFESLVLAGGASSVTTGIVDDDTASLSLAATPSLTEAGGTIVYTATITQPPVSALLVTLSNGATITIAAGATSGTVNVPLAASDDVYVDPSSVSASIASTSGGGIGLVVDATPAVTTIGDTIDDTTVSLSATPSVAEGGTIVYTATLTSAAQSPVTVTISGGTTITIAAGATSGTANVAAPSDDVIVDAGSVTRSIVSATGGNFENLVIGGAPATTTISDTIDTTTVSLSASASVAEGGSITYTASLTSAAASAVTVTLSNGATISIAAGASSGTVSVPAPSDDVYVDAGSASATISSATGGGFENLAINPAAANTSITDTIDTTTVSLSASASVAEGGNIVYTASVTSPAQSAVSVTLSNGATITIAAGASSGTVSVAAPSDDVVVDAGSVSATISSATGGGFENLAINPAAASTSITDTVDATTVSLTATPRVAEGGTIVYTASLTSAAQSAVTVTLSNGATINIAAGASSGSVSVDAPSDDVYVDAGSVSATISSASGGNFESLLVNPAVATTGITDTVNATTVSLAASASVAEGGTIVYTASLTSPAQSAVTVTLSNGATISIAAGASSGTVNVAAPGDDPYVDAGSVSATISSAIGGNFESLAVDPTAATTSITDTSDATTVSLAATPSVAEGGSIVYTATLSNAAQSAVTVTITGGLTIAIAAGATTGTLSVPAPSDDVYVDAGSVSRSITAATGGNFESLTVNPAAATTTITDTIATTTVSLTATASVAEGGSIVYTASLTNPALTAVTVTLSNGATINIAAGASSGTVSVAAPSDDVYVDAGSVSATISSASGGNFEALAIDPSAATTAVTDTIATTTVSLGASASAAEGGNITYTASLNNPAQTAVTVTLSNGATINIAAGASSGTVSVAAPSDDVYVDAGNVSATIASATGGNFENLAINPAVATTAITDTIATTTVSLTATASVAEGGNITYTASLNNPAQTAVTVTLSNGATINIAAGASSGSVSVPAPGDDAVVDGGTVSATISSASGGNFEALAISPAAATTTITDTVNTTTVSLSASASVAEGGTIVYTATLTNPAQTAVTVNLSNGATITIAAGASSGTANVAAPSDDVYVDTGSVSATISSASGGNFEALAINPAAATTTISDTIDDTTVALSATASVGEGGNIVYTAALSNAAQTAVTVTITGGATITIAAGATTGNVSVAAPSDDVVVDAGSVSRSIVSATGGNFESLTIDPTAATTNVTDTIATTTVSLTATASVTEGGSIVYTASLTNPAQTAVTVTLSNGATINIAAGASSGTVSVAAPSDDVVVDAGSVTATISGASGGNFENLAISPAAATTAITDTVNTTTLSLTGDATIAEGSSGTYTVSLTSAAQTAVTVNLAYSGTAADGSDYTGVASVTIPAGASSATFNIATLDDAQADNGETFTVSVTSATGGNFESLIVSGSASSVTTTINDEAILDTVLVSLSGPAGVTEGVATGDFTVTLGQAAVTAVTVNLTYAGTAADGSDYTGVVSVTIPAGATSATFSLATLDDALADSGETIIVGLGAISGGGFEAIAAHPVNNSVTTTISDEATPDTVLVSLSGPASVAEGAATTDYTVSLSQAAVTPVTVALNYGGTASGGGTDYTGVVSVFIPAGAISVTFALPTTGDALDEANETVVVSLGSISGGGFEAIAADAVNNTVTTTITDDDPTPSLAIDDVSVNEAAGTMTFTVTLSAASGQTVSVNYATSNGTASAGSDYTAIAGTLTFTPGVLTQTITVPISDDTATESSETFAVTLSGAVNATIADATGVGTIVDNDAPPQLDLDANDSSGAAGTGFVTVYVEQGAALAIADADISIADVDSANLAGATIVVTNRQSGDVLNLPGLPPGITANVNTTATQITITLSGTASPASYQSVIAGITFAAGGGDAPVTTARTVTVSVTDGTSSSNVATTTIAVTAVNDAPDTNAVTANGNEDTLITVALAGSDPDGTVAGFVIGTLPANGTLYSDAAGTVPIDIGDVVAGPVYFRPINQWNGSASFQYAARDDGGLTDATPATATINVAAVNDGAPVATNDTFTGIVGTPIVITQAQLLANDLLFDNAAITGIGVASGGTLVDNGDGTYNFTPTAGSGSFTYTLTDQDGQTSTGTVAISAFATRDDLITVHESALPGGTGGGVRTVTGNLLGNDPGATSITGVGGVTDGSAGDLDSRTGYVAVQQVVGGVNAGVLTVDVSGSGLGDYSYTLNDNVDHSAAANNNSLTSAISYATNTGSGNAQITIVDDRPQAFDRTIEVTEDALPSYNLVLVLDVSGSMTQQIYGGEVRQVNADGTVTITTRLDMAKAALVELVDQYFNQAQNVSVKLVTFASTATILNGNVAYTDKATLVAAINGITGSGGTDYTDALNAAQTAFGTVDPSQENIIYFLSDGVPTEQDTVNPATSTGYASFVNTNNIASYGVGIGSGISNTGPLNGIHNVDGDGNGTVDPAIIVPDLNELANTLISTVPTATGGSVVSGGGVGNALGADDGYVQSITLQLDSNADGTPDTGVTFTYDPGTGQISWPGGFPAGSPASSDTLTLNGSNGFTLGTLTFNFATGEYTYFTSGMAFEGDSFAVQFVARDNDGDVTMPTTLTFSVVDGQPIARPDIDTLFANQASYTGNVISGLSTDGGLAVGSLTTDFSAQGSGADKVVDGATVSSIVFQGQTFDLTTNVGATAALGGTYTVSAGQLIWTHASNGSSLRFNSDGAYQYVPTAAETPSTPSTGPTTVNLTTGATITGTSLTIGALTFTGIARNSTAETAGVRRTNGDGIGVNLNSPGGDNTDTIGNLETLVIRFDTATNPYGVESVSIDPDNSNSNLGGSVALTYAVYHIDGHLLGQFYSNSLAAVTVPSEYSNIGRIEITANSDAYASIGSVSYNTITNSAAAAIAPVEIGYTLTDTDGDSSSATLTLRAITNSIAGDAGNNALTGNAANDFINGGTGDDTIDGAAGNDLLVGDLGNDVLSGGTGNDILRGGAGNDNLSGGDGNDMLSGGAGNDTLTGGNGADVFGWSLSDRGVPGTPAVDTVQSFDNSTAAVGGDVLDLRDLLQGETHNAINVGNLQNYLHFETSGGNTTVQISSSGGFVNGFNVGAVDQTIVLQGVDLMAGFSTDNQVIQDLLNRGKLVTDSGS